MDAESVDFCGLVDDADRVLNIAVTGSKVQKKCEVMGELMDTIHRSYTLDRSEAPRFADNIAPIWASAIRRRTCPRNELLQQGSAEPPVDSAVAVALSTLEPLRRHRALALDLHPVGDTR